MLTFKVVPKGKWLPDHGKSIAYLYADNWNDYSFFTLFGLKIYDQDGYLHDIGGVRIAFKGQTTGVATNRKLDSTFDCLTEEFFSLGSDTDFYKNLNKLNQDLKHDVLLSLRDIVFQPEIIDDIADEEVFRVSLLRDSTLSLIKGQYLRVLNGGVELTDFNFRFARTSSEGLGDLSLDFIVEVESTPRTNIHAIIGRNGVGKTTLLNGMISAITDPTEECARFYSVSPWFSEHEIDKDYFSSLISVSFSAFDPFEPPNEQADPTKGTCYFYIGLKDSETFGKHKSITNLVEDCSRSLLACFRNLKKTASWRSAVEKLSSDDNFSRTELASLLDIYHELRSEKLSGEQSDSAGFLKDYLERVTPILSGLSSGHAVVLLTITRLIETVNEKSLILLDEPESHLHPPLLSAFIRALSDLLNEQNGVAIIATHSPVVLQEVPRSCVWKMFRKGSDVICDRPNIETFAENVGVLTSEVFRLEVEKSGFHES